MEIQPSSAAGKVQTSRKGLIAPVLPTMHRFPFSSHETQNGKTKWAN